MPPFSLCCLPPLLAFCRDIGSWGGGFCKLARGYLRLAAKCLADLTPQQTLGHLLELLGYSANFQKPLRKLYDASSSARL